MSNLAEAKRGLAILEFNDVNIKVNDDSMMSLTDLWKASGSKENSDPRQWRRKEGAGFIAAVSKKLKGTHSPLLVTTRAFS